MQWIPLLTALGAGTAIGNYLGAGRGRREVRSNALNCLAATETSRFTGHSGLPDAPNFQAALRDFETAALIARIPRPVVQHYLAFAQAAQGLSREDFEEKGGDEDQGAGMVDADFDKLVRRSAEIVTGLAWRPWWKRCTYRWDLRTLRKDAAVTDSPGGRRHIAYAQYSHGRLPGPLGELFDKQFTKRKNPSSLEP